MRPPALVTGATRGIGGGIARALAAAGYDVTATGLTAEEIASAPPIENVRYRQLDVGSDGMIAELVGGFDRLDALVNCAGMIARDNAEFDVAIFAKVIDINLVGTMRMCVAAHPLLAKTGGAIVNTASMLSFFGGPGVPAYSASKGGVAQLTKSLAGAWAKDGIRVNAIAPGWIETELTRALVADDTRSSSILARTPAGRWGTPDDIGGAVVYLLSEGAKFVTGAVLPVDGGYMAM